LCAITVWLEKDALSGIFEVVLGEYGVTLNVGRGYDGWDSIHNGAVGFRGTPGQHLPPHRAFERLTERLVDLAHAARAQPALSVGTAVL